MMQPQLTERFRELSREPIPLPGSGKTAERHRRLFEAGREDLSLARLAEAHWDAVAILAEAARSPAPNALYGVWASEIPGKALSLEKRGTEYSISGTKRFCSGVGLVDRALITVAAPEQRLVEVDLQRNPGSITLDTSEWTTDAFRGTQTGSVTFIDHKVPTDAIAGDDAGWYLNRAGFWHGACGPAACWAGGVAGLLTFALRNKRTDCHTLAHLGALHANVWALEGYLEVAGREIDRTPHDRAAAQIRALSVRHLVEQLCTDTLRRFARAYGPAPLSMNPEIGRRYQEADLYLRQSHAERDLEALGHCLITPATQDEI